MLSGVLMLTILGIAGCNFVIELNRALMRTLFICIRENLNQGHEVLNEFSSFRRRHPDSFQVIVIHIDHPPLIFSHLCLVGKLTKFSGGGHMAGSRFIMQISEITLIGAGFMHRHHTPHWQGVE